MTAIQKFFLVFAGIAGLILYLAAGVLSEPPMWAKLFAKEEVTVTASEVQSRNNKRPALPVIDVRDASGSDSMIQGYRWMGASEAAAIVEAAPVGAVIEVPRYQGALWRGLSGIGDMILLIVSLVASFGLLFSLWMIWKLRAR